jgi:hypothetical protein
MIDTLAWVLMVFGFCLYVYGLLWMLTRWQRHNREQGYNS